MKTSIHTTLAAAIVTACGATANADLVTGHVTADNHYAIYSSTASAFFYHGGNELGAGGSTGGYNWSNAESYSFEAGDFIYIAAWSDDAVAQGLLADLHTSSLGSILSGDPRWQVYRTDLNRGDGDPHPLTGEIAGHVGFADANSLWQNPFVGDPNGAQPWGTIAGISPNARWMWLGSEEDADPLHGGSGAGEMLIFRTAVPTPGSLAILGLSGLAGLRRKR
jgi:hypothetical protein